MVSQQKDWQIASCLFCKLYHSCLFVSQEGIPLISMKTIFLFIPIYFYTSDFLRTNYIKYLASKYRVFVFVPEGFFKNNATYFQSPNTAYISWDVQYPKFWNFFGKILRYCFIRKFDYEPVLQRHHKKSFFWKRRIIRPFAYLFPKNLLTSDVFSWLEKLFIPRSKKFLDYCVRYKPDLIMTPTPGFNHFDAEAIILARKFGLRTASINFSWDNLHGGSKNLRKPDYLIAWNDMVKETAVKMHGFSPEKVFVSGVIRFDNYFKQEESQLTKEEFLIKKGLNPREKTILITTVTDGNYPHEDKLIERLIDGRERGRFFGYPNIFIRLHPKDEFVKYEKFSKSKCVMVEEAGKKMKVELGTKTEMDEEDHLNLKHTLMYSDVVINYASTMTLEACIFDKPIINIGFPAEYLNAYNFSHYKPIVEIGAVRVAKSYEDLINMVNYYFDKPQSERQNRLKIIERFVKFTDGLSYKRNVDLLGKIIK